MTTLAFSPDGRLLATGDNGDQRSDGQVRLWDTATGDQHAELHGHTGPVNTLAFSSDGGLLATGDDGRGSDGKLRLWDPATGRRHAELDGHTGPVNTLAFSPDGLLLATGDGNGFLRIWSTVAYTLIARIIGFDDGWAVLLPDGSYKLVGDPGGRMRWTMKLCRFEPGELDGLDPSVRRLDPDAPLPGLERYHPSTNA